ncbi:MAG: cobalamin-binding protein, partial [Candidatus Obscuribacterales bacterium]|nr:cobalamin-binding protein [Candidatus Obscuribacterales bacterium]
MFGEMENLRIVSLIASATEIVCALGLRDNLVGRSHECDYPQSVLSLPVCTGPKFKTDVPSAEIDKQVRTLLQEALSVYRVDAEQLEQLQPSHIITQSQCEVCAVSLKDVEAAACSQIGSKPKIVSLEPNCLLDIYEDIKKVGTALGVDSRSDALVRELKASIKIISDKSKTSPNRPSVALIEWIDPLMAAGNWMPELVELAAGKNVFGEAGKHAPVMNWKQVLVADADIMIIAPCGFGMTQTLEEMPSLMARPGWSDLSAVKSKRVFIADGNQYFNRPGPRVLDSLEIMAEMIHPDMFPG